MIVRRKKNKKGLKTSPRCVICTQEMFPDAFRFRGMCATCSRLYTAMAKNINATELILRLIYQKEM